MSQANGDSKLSPQSPIKLSMEAAEKVARLARLKLSEDELSKISEQLSAVLSNFEQISKVDTGGVAPLVTPTEIAASLRPDRAAKEDVEKLLENAIEKSGRLFKVPPVV